MGFVWVLWEMGVPQTSTRKYKRADGGCRNCERGGRGGAAEEAWMGTRYGVQLEGAAGYFAADSLGEKVMEATYKGNLQPSLPASH